MLILMPCGFHLPETVDDWARDAAPAVVRATCTAVRRGQVFARRRLGLLQPAGPAGHRRHRAAGRDLRPGRVRGRRALRVVDPGRRPESPVDRAVPRDLRLPVVRRRAHVSRPRRPRGLGAALPGLRRQGGRQRVPALPPAPGHRPSAARRRKARRRPGRVRRDGRRRADAGSRPIARPRPLDAGPPPDPTARSRRRHARLLRRPARPSTTTGTCAAGATSDGPIHDAAWNAELDAGRALARRPADRRRDRRARRRDRLVVAAAGRRRASSRCTTRAPAPLDRARERLVAHGLRAHLHVRDAWAEPGPRRSTRVFTGFWLSHVPRDRLAAFLARRPPLAQAGRHVRVHRFAARPAVERRRPSGAGRRRIRSAASPTAASSRSSRSTTSRTTLDGRAWPRPVSPTPRSRRPAASS